MIIIIIIIIIIMIIIIINIQTLSATVAAHNLHTIYKRNITSKRIIRS